MYRNYYGLTRKPFDLIPDPNVVYLSEAHQEAVAILRYGVVDRKGFLLLTGDIGTGKTTLLQNLVQSIDRTVHVCLVTNPTLSADDFYYYLSDKYGLAEYDGSKAKFMIRFAEFLRQCRARDERVLLIVDEAHVLPVELLDEIRLLSNQEYTEFGVMSIFLVGQPELNARLADPHLMPLRQRIGIRFHLKPFSLEETEKYIKFRLGRAGAQRVDFFGPDALQLIHQASGGVPRIINVLCDQALLSGFAASKRIISGEIIRECVREMQIPGEGGVAEVAAREGKIGDGLGRWISLVLLGAGVTFILAAGYSLFAPESWPGHGWLNMAWNSAWAFMTTVFP